MESKKHASTLPIIEQLKREHKLRKDSRNQLASNESLPNCKIQELIEGGDRKMSSSLPEKREDEELLRPEDEVKRQESQSVQN